MKLEVVKSCGATVSEHHFYRSRTVTTTWGKSLLPSIHVSAETNEA